MSGLIKSYLKDEAGAAAAEYALLLSLIGTAIAFAANSLGVAISTAITTIAALL
jgi:pilus assembly protein Flp/PilA